LRSHDPDDNVALAETASRFIDEGLTGWDLAGPEEGYPDPPNHGAADGGARRPPRIRPPARESRRRHGPAAFGSRSTPANGAARDRSAARSPWTRSASLTGRRRARVRGRVAV